MWPLVVLQLLRDLTAVTLAGELVGGLQMGIFLSTCSVRAPGCAHAKPGGRRRSGSEGGQEERKMGWREGGDRGTF